MAEIGWQGVRITVPDDWEPGQFSGDSKAGHIRIDSVMVQRAVVRWLPPDSTRDVYRRAQSRVDGVDEILSNYLKAIARTERKQRHTLKTSSATRLIPKRRLGKKAVRFYSWQCEEDGRQGHGLVWYCESCERTIIAEVDGEKGENVDAMAAEVLGTLADHAEDGRNLWSVFGLSVRVPERFLLTSSTMMGGKVELRLEHKGEVVALQRWVANVALGGDDLEVWAKHDILKPMRRNYSLRARKEAVLGHEGIHVTGYRRGLQNHALHILSRFVRRERPFFLDGRIWHCPNQNKLFTVNTLMKESNRGLLDEIVESSQCGDESGGDTA